MKLRVVAAGAVLAITVSAAGAFATNRPVDLRVEGPNDTLLAIEVLKTIPVQNEYTRGYKRSLFPHWRDVDGDGCDARFLPDAVGKWGLVHAAVGGLLLGADLARGAIDHVGAGGLEGAGDFNRIGRGDATLHPVVCRDANRHRQCLWPGRAHRSEDLQRVAQAVFQRSAVGVGSVVGQRADEA